MPRVSRQQADKNRDTIEEVAARLFREEGLKGIGVADLMAAAGLTHGGFYGHFASKDALAAAALERAFAQSCERWKQRVARHDSKAEALRGIVRGYLAPAQRDHPGQACAAAMLAGDVAREPPERLVHGAFLNGVIGLTDILAGLNEGATDRQAHDLALVQLSTMVGALLLARATRGAPVSDDILAAARIALAGMINTATDVATH